MITKLMSFPNYLLMVFCMICFDSFAQNVSYTYVGEGWSKNSVNTVKFRKNAITTHLGVQFIAYYDQDRNLVLAKRKVNSKTWETSKTQYKGFANDAHNSISIAVDGAGYLHVSWSNHDTPLRYAISKSPLSLELGDELLMTGNQEEKVTYPEFYNLPDGNLLFFYRSGKSGRGNLVINSYDVKTSTWSQLQSNLIDGEDQRSAYWQAVVDANGIVHLSWVWRETWDVKTNHDLCYARSLDGGKTWEKSTSESYQLPITLETAEYACRIPQNSNLINQTSMTTDDNSNPYIVSYWNQSDVPQYQIVYLKHNTWRKANTNFRSTPFVLGGGGTKSIPISRPDILIEDTVVAILFRDASRGNKVSLAYTSDIESSKSWHVDDISVISVGQWEPNYDIALWNSKNKLHVFFQNVTQIDEEGIADTGASEVKVLEVKNLNKLIRS